LLSLGRLLRTIVPVRTAAAITAVATVPTAAILLGLGLLRTLAAAAVPAATITAAATSVAAALGLLAAGLASLLRLRAERSRDTTQQRQRHGGRQKTFHFLLRRALKRGPGLSLDSNVGLAR
jgi:hypothetical protein